MKTINKIVSKSYTVILSVAVTFSAHAQNTPQKISQPGYYEMALGDMQVIALSDGTAPQKLNELLKDASRVK